MASRQKVLKPRSFPVFKLTFEKSQMSRNAAAPAPDRLFRRFAASKFDFMLFESVDRWISRLKKSVMFISRAGKAGLLFLQILQSRYSSCVGANGPSYKTTVIMLIIIMLSFLLSDGNCQTLGCDHSAASAVSLSRGKPTLFSNFFF